MTLLQRHTVSYACALSGVMAVFAILGAFGVLPDSLAMALMGGAFVAWLGLVTICVRNKKGFLALLTLLPLVVVISALVMFVFMWCRTGCY